jgi:hypothetical protein
MLRDWDLWPYIVAGESDAGHIRRMARSMARMAAAVRAFGISVEQATSRLAALTARHEPPPTARR